MNSLNGANIDNGLYGRGRNNRKAEPKPEIGSGPACGASIDNGLDKNNCFYGAECTYS